MYVVDADLKSYFDTIPHDRLMDRVREKVADGRVLELIEAFLQAGSDGRPEGVDARSRGRRKGRSSVRCWRTSISTRWTI